MGMAQHIIDEIDIVNLSAGLDHAADQKKDCSADGPECLASKKVRDVIEDEAVLIAAAGDKIQTAGLCCPSTMKETVSVGGVIAKCTAGTEYKDPKKGNIHTPNTKSRPPNAFWIESEGKNHINDTLCTNRGCGPGENCLENRRYDPWNKNHEFGQYAPNILAPVVIPVKSDEKDPFLASGSSYGPPFVTGQVANILDALQEADRSPQPTTIRKGLREAQKEIPRCSIGMLSGYELGDWFGDRYGLDFELNSEDDSESFFTTIKDFPDPE